jgi:ketosteroid isomerase-like protein
MAQREMRDERREKGLTETDDPPAWVRFSRLSSLVSLCLACSPRPVPAFTPAHRAAIVDSVQTMLTAWRDALNRRDFASAARFYSTAPEFRWFQDGELKYRSGKEIGDSITAMAPAMRGFTISLIEPEITAIAPGVAVLTTNFAQQITDTSGTAGGFAGAITATIVHGDSGWKFLVGQTSSVIPPPSPPARVLRRG